MRCIKEEFRILLWSIASSIEFLHFFNIILHIQFHRRCWAVYLSKYLDVEKLKITYFLSLVLYRKPYYWDFLGTTSLSYVKDRAHSRHPAWLSQSLCPLFYNVPWDLDAGVILKISDCVWPPHSHLFSAFWPIVGFCSGSHLPHKEASLIERKSCTCRWG